MIPTRIQRKRTKGWRKPEGAAYVGRGSNWGNPYRVGDESAFMSTGAPVFGIEEPLTAEDVVQLYRLDLANSVLGAEVYERIRIELAGKNLMCWCPLNQPCHADVLLERRTVTGSPRERRSCSGPAPGWEKAAPRSPAHRHTDLQDGRRHRSRLSRGLLWRQRTHARPDPPRRGNHHRSRPDP